MTIAQVDGERRLRFNFPMTTAQYGVFYVVTYFAAFFGANMVAHGLIPHASFSTVLAVFSLPLVYGTSIVCWACFQIFRRSLTVSRHRIDISRGRRVVSSFAFADVAQVRLMPSADLFTSYAVEFLANDGTHLGIAERPSLHTLFVPLTACLSAVLPPETRFVYSGPLRQAPGIRSSGLSYGISVGLCVLGGLGLVEAPTLGTASPLALCAAILGIVALAVGVLLLRDAGLQSAYFREEVSDWRPQRSDTVSALLLQWFGIASPPSTCRYIVSRELIRQAVRSGRLYTMLPVAVLILAVMLMCAFDSSDPAQVVALRWWFMLGDVAAAGCAVYGARHQLAHFWRSGQRILRDVEVSLEFDGLSAWVVSGDDRLPITTVGSFVGTVFPSTTAKANHPRLDVEAGGRWFTFDPVLMGPMWPRVTQPPVLVIS